jgi:hypothetical protein
MKALPHGGISTAWFMLNDTLGTVKKYDATSTEKPMCDTGKPGK